MHVLYKKLKNEQGYSLLLALFVFVILSIFVISISTVSSNTLKTSTNERLSQSAYYIAEAGIVEKRYELKKQIIDAHNAAVNEYTNEVNKNPSNYSKIDFKEIFKKHLKDKVKTSKSIINDFDNQFANNPNAEITIKEKQKDDILTYTIESEGTIDNFKRTASQDVEVNLNSISTTYTPGPKFSVLAKSDIIYEYYDMYKQIQGKLASATNPFIKVNGWSGDTLKVDYKPDNFNRILNAFKEKLQFDFSKFEKISYHNVTDSFIKGNNLIAEYGDDNKTLKLNNDVKLNNFTTNSNINFNINVGDSEKVLYVNNIDVNGTLNIQGTGSLTIFVKNKMNFNYSRINFNGTPDKLNIYYVGSDMVRLNNDLKMKANLYIKNADIHFAGGSNVSGSFYSNGNGKAIIDNGSVSKDVVFIMPNYDFSITGGVDMYGSIVCKSLFLGGGSKIISQENSGIGGDKIEVTSSNPIQLKSIVEK